MYKPALDSNNRRVPPLPLRAELNKSSASLPPGSSPGPNHYRTASGRARTPSSTASWTSRPSDRYYMGSTDQSTRSASLTSIVEMYQRPMTASSTCPVMRPTKTLYYDYSEDFNNADLEAAHSALPLSPFPCRTGAVARPAILRHDLELKVHGALNNVSIPTNPNSGFGTRYSQTESSIEESFDSYLQGTHDDSIEEIERVIADAISNAAADKLAAASRNVDEDNALRNRQEDVLPNMGVNSNQAWRLAATERYYGLKASAGISDGAAVPRRTSQGSYKRTATAQDPAFADFTSLLSSFERLAKSPFSRLSDEDDADERESRRSSKISTMETLDELEALDSPYQKRHRRNAAVTRARTPSLNRNEISAQQPTATSEATSVLTPDPLSPCRQKIRDEVRQRFMKALPPLPPEQFITTERKPAFVSSKSETSKIDSAISQVRSASLRSQVSRCSSPGKLRLRVRTPSSSGDTGPAIVPYGPEQRSLDENRIMSSTKPPPKLKLKISRNQLGHGRSAQIGSVIRNNRLKQCNALADVAQPPRLHSAKKADAADNYPEMMGNVAGEIPSDAGPDGQCSLGGSCQPSDQFNLSYPPTPIEGDAALPSSGSSHRSADELETARSEGGEPVSRRVKPKFSFLRLRSANAAPTTLVKPAPCTNYCDGVTHDKAREGITLNSHFDATMNENPPSISTKSERVGNRVKRWASDARRAVRLYVRRTLVRTPRSANM